MAGLLNPRAEAERPEAQGSTTVGDEEGMEPNVTDEEQRAYDAFVHLGFDLIYGENNRVRPGILQLLDEDPGDLRAVLPETQALQQVSPLIALAATAVIVTLETVRRSPERPDDAVIFHGGKALLEDLAEIAERAKLATFSDEDVSQAFRIAADIYREAAESEGMVDEAQLKREFAEIVTAEREGRLGQVLPQFAGLEQRLKSSGPGAEEAQAGAATERPSEQPLATEEGR